MNERIGKHLHVSGLEAILDGAGSDDDRRHIERCPRCRVQLRLLRLADTADIGSTIGVEDSRQFLPALRDSVGSTLFNSPFTNRTMADSGARVSILGRSKPILGAQLGLSLKSSVQPLAQPDPGFMTTLATASAISRTDMPSTIEAPRRIGPYEIDAELGRGGMGVVYRAIDTRDGCAVALKSVWVTDPAALAGLRREINALAQVDHPGVIAILDQGVHGGSPWYAMPMIDGAPLRYLEAKGRWLESQDEIPDQEALLEILGQLRMICDALDRLHSLGIVHRDLKPDNIMVDAAGRPILIDFGLTIHVGDEQSRDRLDLHPQRAGTAPYMAPEQIHGDMLDGRTDLYALGCIAYELLTGRPPFLTASVQGMVMQHLTRQAEPVSSRCADGALPQGLDELIARLLCKEMSRRVAYAADVAKWLERLGVPTPPGPVRPIKPYLFRAPLVEREELLLDLRRCLDQSSDDVGPDLLLVRGESGAGKTRLAMELTRQAHQEGWLVEIGRCHGGADMALTTGRSAGPLHPFHHTLQGLADRCMQRGAKETKHLFGERALLLADYLPALATLPGVSPDRPEPLPSVLARQRVLRALWGTLAARSDDAPLLLILDDAQWLDGLSLGFLEMLATGRFRSARVSLLITYRQEEANDRLRALADAPRARTFEMPLLTNRGVGRMAAGMLALEATPGPLTEFLAHQSLGNPLFVAEYLRAAVGEGWLLREASGQWLAASGANYDQLPVPASIRELLGARLAALPMPTCHLAAELAALGPEFTLDLVAQLDREVGRQLEDQLGELTRRGILKVDGDLVRFTCNAGRTLAYDLIRGDSRWAATTHLRWAEGIERLGDDAPWSFRFDLGLHWERAGNIARSTQAYLAAARAARQQHDHEQSERLYRAYLAICDRTDPEGAVARLEMARYVISFGGRKQEALVELEQARTDAAQCGDVVTEGECLQWLGVTHNDLGEADRAQSKLRSALEIFRRLGERALEGRALGNLASVLTRQGLSEGRALYEQSLAIHRSVGDMNSAGKTLNHLGLIQMDLNNFEEGANLLNEAIEILRDCGDRVFEGIVLTNLALTFIHSGQLEEAIELFERGLTIHHQVGNRRSEAIARTNLGQTFVELGRWEEALKTLEQALDEHRAIGNRRFEAVTQTYLARMALYQGDLEEAECQLAAARPIQEELHDTNSIAQRLGYEAELARRRGDVPRLVALLKEGADAIGQLEASAETLWLHTERGHLALARGEDPQPHLEAAQAMLAKTDVGPRSTTAKLVNELITAMAT